MITLPTILSPNRKHANDLLLQRENKGTLLPFLFFWFKKRKKRKKKASTQISVSNTILQYKKLRVHEKWMDDSRTGTRWVWSILYCQKVKKSIKRGEERKKIPNQNTTMMAVCRKNIRSDLKSPNLEIWSWNGMRSNKVVVDCNPKYKINIQGSKLI